MRYTDRAMFSNGGNIHTMTSNGPKYDILAQNSDGVNIVTVDGEKYYSISVGSGSFGRLYEKPYREDNIIPVNLTDIKKQKS